MSRRTHPAADGGGALDQVAAPGDAGGELGVLFPDAEVEVRDPDGGGAVALTVREFRFREGLEAQVAARPLVEALAAAAEGAGEDGPDAGAIEAAMAAHAGLWLDLIARACGREAAWLARLGDSSALALSNAMWSANGSFFVRRVAAAAAAARRRPSRSRGSSTRSSAPATDAATTRSPAA